MRDLDRRFEDRTDGKKDVHFTTLNNGSGGIFHMIKRVEQKSDYRLHGKKRFPTKYD
jgi:hypothetical protein